MPSLTIETGPAKGRVFQLSGSPQFIGRNGDIQILDTAASRKHAEIFQMGKMFLIRDLQSRNGTFVNEERVQRDVALRPGDRIRIGSSLLIFEKPGTAEHNVEFVQDTVDAVSTVEIKLGAKGAHAVPGTERTPEPSTVERLTTMYEVARALGRETSLQGVVERILELAMTSVKPTYCYIFIRDEATGHLVPRVWRDLHRLKRREISRSIVTRAVQLRHSILTADAAADERFSQSDSVVIGQIRSVICAPLIARDHINGAMYMGRETAANPFSDGDLELATAIAFQGGIALENVATHSERRTEIMTLVKTLVGAMDLRVPDQRGHSERVAAYAAAIADQLALSKEESEDIIFAALLHDIGKVTTSEKTKAAVASALGRPIPERLCHPYLGAKMLEELPGFGAIVPGVKYHHERLDGFGGPESLSGEAIPLIARIVAVANRFDHLTSDPIGASKRPLPMHEALEALEQPGEGLDDAITHALVQAQTTGTGVGLPRLVLQDFC